MKVSHFGHLAFVGENIARLMEPECATVCAVKSFIGTSQWPRQYDQAASFQILVF